MGTYSRGTNGPTFVMVGSATDANRAIGIGTTPATQTSCELDEVTFKMGAMAYLRGKNWVGFNVTQDGVVSSPEVDTATHFAANKVCD